MMYLIKYLCAALILVMAGISQADVLLKDINGDVISFSSLKGKWVFINYWASWCETCIEEIPELNHFYRKYKKKSVIVFAVNYDGLPINKQRKLIKKFHIKYPSLSTDPVLALELDEVVGVPVTFVINPCGTLSNTLYGSQNSKTLESVINLKNAVESTTSGSCADVERL